MVADVVCVRPLIYPNMDLYRISLIILTGAHHKARLLPALYFQIRI